MFIGNIQNTNVLHTTNNIVFCVYETNTIYKMVLVRVIIFLIINKNSIILICSSRNFLLIDEKTLYNRFRIWCLYLMNVLDKADLVHQLDYSSRRFTNVILQLVIVGINLGNSGRQKPYVLPIYLPPNMSLALIFVGIVGSAGKKIFFLFLMLTFKDITI